MKNLIPPLPASNPDDQHITLLILTVSILFTLTLALANVNRLTMFLFSFVLGVGLLLVYKGQVKLVGLMVPLVSLCLLTYLIFQNHGLRDTAVFALPAIIIAASLLNGRWGAVAFGFLSLAIILTLGLAETQGWNTSPYPWTNNPADYIVVSFVIVLIVILQFATLGRLTQSLQRTRLELDERTRTENQLKQRAEELRLLYHTGLALSSGQDLYHAVRAFVKELKNLMIVDTFYIVNYDEQTDIISYPLYITYEGDLDFPPRKLSKNPGVTSAVIQARQTLVIPDITDPEIQKRYKIVVLVDMGVRSYIGIPLMIKDRTIGVLSVQAREANAYTDAQIRMLETLATQVAITVDKSRLFDQLQQELLERKRAEAEARLLNTELEERVRVRTAQLEGANKELESFSYSVSHDLRAPLRGIDGFSFILEQEYASRLDETGQRYLYRIRESVQRMNQLINDLLTFSRLGRQELHKRPIVLLPLVQDVLSDLQPEFSGRQVDITLANDFPICEADPNLLRQVFANILGNALKYSRKRDETRIEVNWKNTDGEVVYYIRDNGVGFDMQYADKLFSVFYRLHRVEEFEGSGVGLATVHRIITRHGGRIWVEAEVDKGATFYFTLTAGE